MVTSIGNLVLYMVKYNFILYHYSDSQLVAGPRLTTNCLTDHRIWYNLQVSYDYGHDLNSIIQQ
jgi:hypothetical protein